MPTLQNGQTNSNNLSVNYRWIFWVCLTILWGWCLKGKKTRLQVGWNLLISYPFQTNFPYYFSPDNIVNNLVYWCFQIEQKKSMGLKWVIRKFMSWFIYVTFFWGARISLRYPRMVMIIPHNDTSFSEWANWLRTSVWKHVLSPTLVIKEETLNVCKIQSRRETFYNKMGSYTRGGKESFKRGKRAI